MPCKRIEKRCEWCETPFLAHHPKGRFCSQECYASQQRVTKPKGPKPVRNCNHCGEPYKQMGPRHLHCRQCHGYDHEENVMKPWRKACRKAEARARAPRRRRLYERLAKESYVLETPEQREERKAREVREAKRQSDELAALIEAQERDSQRETWNFRDVSLDAERESKYGWDHKYTLYMYAPDPYTGIFEELNSERLWGIVGEMTPEDVARMDDHSLRRLQERLQSEGLVTYGVTRAERERLREPDAHSGGHIKKSKSRSGRRRRKEQVALMAGKRTSRTPRKRWTRESAEEWTEVA